MPTSRLASSPSTAGRFIPARATRTRRVRARDSAIRGTCPLNMEPRELTIWRLLPAIWPISPQEVEGGVAEAGQCVAASGVANAAVVFAEIHVAKVVEGFDPPVSAPVSEQRGGLGKTAREAGDSVDHLDGFLAVAFDRSSELAGL